MAVAAGTVTEEESESVSISESLRVYAHCGRTRGVTLLLISLNAVSDLPCNIRREGGESLVIGGSSLVISEGKACNPL